MTAVGCGTVEVNPSQHSINQREKCGLDPATRRWQFRALPDRARRSMTGFNHSADCGCGWCVNYGGRSRTNRPQLLADLRQRDAVNALKSNAARSISGCYVNPNAKCPVCGDAVYFYANEHGSRVFFDDLGPPWPKHHCTDNPREPVYPRGAPTRRARGLMQELIAAANAAGLLK